MNFKEIVYCYVSKTIPMPADFSQLRESFIKNEFSEKQINPNKWLYKRGAAFSLVFNYNSEVMEMQVILEKIDNQLQISVGNWGFPFEPLMMKKRFQKNLEEFVSQISKNGVLTHDAKGSQEIIEQAKKKKLHASVFMFFAVIGLVLYEIFIRRS